MNGPPLRLFALLAACAVLGPLQLNVYLPSLPLVQQEFGADVSEVQWTVSLAMAAFGLGLILFGPLSDRHGRRPVLIAGLAIFTVTSAIAALAPSLPVLAGARMLQSAGASIVFITARGVVADLSPREQLQRSVAQLTMIMLMGQMVAPLLGNLVMTVGGWRTVQTGLAILGALLTLLATQGIAVLQGAVLAFIYALGLGMPLIVMATFFSRLGSGSRFWQLMRGRGFEVNLGFTTLYLHTTSVFSGLLLVFVGVLLASGQLTLLSQWSQQTRLGEWAVSIEQGIENLFFGS